MTQMFKIIKYQSSFRLNSFIQYLIQAYLFILQLRYNIVAVVAVVVLILITTRI